MNFRFPSSTISLHFIFALLCLFFLSACGYEEGVSTSRGYLLPKNDAGQIEYPSRIFENDPGQGDTLSKNFYKGVAIVLQPQGDYTLEVAVNNQSPTISLNLFPLINGNRVGQTPSIIEGKLVSNNLYQFKLSNTSSSPAPFILVPSQNNGDPFPKTTNGSENIQSVNLNATGNYPLTFNVNYIFLGVSNRFPQGTPKDSLNAFASRLHAKIQSLYASMGVNVGQFNVYSSSNLNASFASSQNQKVSFNPESWSAFWTNNNKTDSISADYVNQGFTGDALNSFDIVIVNQIATPGLVGISPFHGYSLQGGNTSTLVAGLNTLFNGGGSKANQEMDIAGTIAHEMGHFLGLRHTTATENDQLIDIQKNINIYDKSIVEDKLSETPFNASCASSLSLANTVKTGTKGIFRFQFDPNSPPPSLSALTSNCPDQDNLMFPTLIPQITQETLSNEQGEIIKKNLALYPH